MNLKINQYLMMSRIMKNNECWMLLKSIVDYFHYVKQPPRRRIMTIDFGRNIDTYFWDLEGHGSLIPLKMKFKNSRFRRNWYIGCPKKASFTDFSDFLDRKHDHKLWYWLNKNFRFLWQVLTLHNIFILIGIFDYNKLNT